MGDDRFCYLHVPEILASQILLDEEDAQLGWELPDDDILVPAHLLPPYQDEDDETILPSAAHPSYPYGNPYSLSSSKPSTSSSTSYQKPSQSSLISRGGGGGSMRTSSQSLGRLSNPGKSLATTLSNLELRSLFINTTLGEEKDRKWSEMGIGPLLGVQSEQENEFGEDVEGLLKSTGIMSHDLNGAGHAANGQGGVDGADGGEAQGQNAGDHPESEEEEMEGL